MDITKGWDKKDLQFMGIKRLLVAIFLYLEISFKSVPSIIFKLCSVQENYDWLTNRPTDQPEKGTLSSIYPHSNLFYFFCRGYKNVINGMITKAKWNLGHSNAWRRQKTSKFVTKKHGNHPHGNTWETAHATITTDWTSQLNGWKFEFPRKKKKEL